MVTCTLCGVTTFVPNAALVEDLSAPSPTYSARGRRRGRRWWGGGRVAGGGGGAAGPGVAPAWWVGTEGAGVGASGGGWWRLGSRMRYLPANAPAPGPPSRPAGASAIGAGRSI